MFRSNPRPPLPAFHPRSRSFAGATLVWLLCSSPGWAGEDPAPARWHLPSAHWDLGLEALTDLPVQVGGRVVLEGPYGLRLAAGLGWLPGPYVELINAILVSAGSYDQSTADMIERSLSDSLVFRAHLGWRPLAAHGFYLELGYGLVALGGGVSREDMITLATGVTPPSLPGGAERGYAVESRLHMLDIELGWEIRLWQGLYLRPALGVALTLDGRTRVSPEFPVLVPGAVDRFTSQAAAYLDEVYERYVFVPCVSLGLGWRFF